MISFILAAALLQAPATAPKPPAKAEELTSLEKAGLSTILREYQQVLQELSQANVDIAKSHPGYHLDPKNPLGGILVKDEPVPAPSKPVVKQDSK